MVFGYLHSLLEAAGHETEQLLLVVVSGHGHSRTSLARKHLYRGSYNSLLSRTFTELCRRRPGPVPGLRTSCR
jgi:hypothetical protein